MYLKYDLDINSDSVWIINTPTAFSRKLPFYMNECGRFHAQRNYYTIREGKDDYLLVFCLSGKGCVEYNGKVRELASNNCILVDCRKRSNFYSMSDKWIFYFMHFSGSGANDFAGILQGMEYASISHADIVHSEMNAIFLGSKTNDILSNVNISMSIHRLLSEFVRSTITQKESVDSVNFGSDIQLVLQFINNEYQSKITLDDMISLVHMSKFHFVRIFKQYVGASPYQYLQTVRINRAKMLLRENDSPIYEISIKTGFPDANNFIRTFKSVTGKTPLQYKKSFIDS